MPIRKDLMPMYGEKWAKVIRPRVLKRAHNACEKCRKHNKSEICMVDAEYDVLWAPMPGYLGNRTHPEIPPFWRDSWGHFVDQCHLPDPIGLYGSRVRRVHLSIAHKNHTPGDDRWENLIALCQWCHLSYDLAHHAESRKLRKDAQKALLAISGGAAITIGPPAPTLAEIDAAHLERPVDGPWRARVRYVRPGEEPPPPVEEPEPAPAPQALTAEQLSFSLQEWTMAAAAAPY